MTVVGSNPIVYIFTICIYLSTPECLYTTVSKLRTMPLQIIVIGAGIAGITAAVSLHQVGHKVTVRLCKSSPQPQNTY